MVSHLSEYAWIPGFISRFCFGGWGGGGGEFLRSALCVFGSSIQQVNHFSIKHRVQNPRRVTTPKSIASAHARDMQGTVWGEPELTSTYSCMALQPAYTLRKETLCVMRQSFTLEARLVSLQL